MTTTEVADLLKGPRGTQVQVVIAREGQEKPVTFNITRDEIPRKSVEDAFWLAPGIAYLDIQSFNENTSKELEDNLKRLGEDNIKGLVLDLRDNPGGLLNEGVEVADHFLDKGQTIVSHRGRASAEKTILRQARQPGPQLSDRRAGQPLLGFGRRDRDRRAAGSRPRVGFWATTPSARAWSRPCIR